MIKTEIRNALKANIVSRVLIEHGQVFDNALNHELLDLHCNYKAEPCLTTLGGHFQQLYYVVSAILSRPESLKDLYERRKAKADDEKSKRAITPRELLVE